MAQAADGAHDDPRRRSTANSGPSAGAMQSDTARDPDSSIEHARAGLRPARGGGGSRWLLRLVETLAWTVLLLFAASVLAMRYWILPNIDLVARIDKRQLRFMGRGSGECNIRFARTASCC